MKIQKIALGLQHFSNALHVFCILVRLGINKQKALVLARAYEISFGQFVSKGLCRLGRN